MHVIIYVSDDDPRAALDPQFAGSDETSFEWPESRPTTYDPYED